MSAIPPVAARSRAISDDIEVAKAVLIGAVPPVIVLSENYIRT
jgi:hypothetical protein